MSEQRKYIRITHPDIVDIVGDRQSISGHSVDISRVGMQVVVNVPLNHDRVRRITFSLPHSHSQFDIPCRVVRGGKTEPEEWILGLEFIYETEAQMLLIEQFVREQRRSQTQRLDDEMREIPRAECTITDVSIDRADTQIVSINNISTEGFLISFDGNLQTEEEIKLSFLLPEDRRKIVVTGRIIYIVENAFNSKSAAGVSYSQIREVDENRIRNFIMSSSSTSAVRNLHDNLVAKLDEAYKITAAGEINTLIERLRIEKLPINVLFERSLNILVRQISRSDHNYFYTDRTDSTIAKHTRSYLSFAVGGEFYYFTTSAIENGADLVFTMPSVLYRSEKRSYQRKDVDDEIKLNLDGINKTLGGKLIDISRRGFLCEIPLGDLKEQDLRCGQSLVYQVNDELGLYTHGEIKHLQKTETAAGMVLRIGVEAGIKRSQCRYKRYSADMWEQAGPNPIPEQPRFHSSIVSYRNKQDQDLVALIDATAPYVEAPVVIVPPGFGRKKEALSPLVLTLLANFKHHQRDLVTVRYDGINRPGESFHQNKDAKRGYEMLGYRINQSLDDLKTTLDFVYDNPHFKPRQVILITSSMSALDARSLLARQDERVHYWISLMGIPAAQPALRRILGGIDIINNCKMGLSNGIIGLLGHLLDMDMLAGDLIEQKYAYISDARLAMSQISIPVTWVFGSHDKWLEAEEIEDIMQVQSQGEREIIEIPTGHNLRTSDDAGKTFRIITSTVYGHLFDEQIEAINPNQQELARMIGAERDRLSKKHINLQEYWQSYLLGAEGGSGYDFYRNLSDFTKFLSLQTQLIDATDGETIADMGCGTGLFVENLLETLSGQKQKVRRLHLEEIDLVQGALDRTREKVDHLVARNPFLASHQISYRQMNLEPNRLIPVQRFINDLSLDFRYLRGRVEGLGQRVIDHLIEQSSEPLYALMRGEPITQEAGDLLALFNPEERQAITDFNRAARYLRGTLDHSDLSSTNTADRQIPLRELETLTTDNLRWDILSFGAADRDLQISFESASFDKIVASLFISYLFSPEEMLREFYRLLKPGGLLLVSSMKPDSDISGIFSNYVASVEVNTDESPGNLEDQQLYSARVMLNEAAGLFELEEEGYFRFFSAKELETLFRTVGYTDIRIHRALGCPPQALIATGRKD